MARAQISIGTPACDAVYSSSITTGSTSWLSFSRIRVFSPAAAAAVTRRISSISRARIENGATSSLRNRCGRPNPVRWLKRSATSAAIVLVGGEDADVLVEPGGRGVVVPRADVHVAAQRVALAPDDERHLGVDLQIREPVDDVDACLLHRA